MNSFINELDLENVLQCPVCFEIPPNIIYLCKVGHHMCERCRKRLTSCPTCKSAITGCRNFLGESVISKLGSEDATTNNILDAANTNNTNTNRITDRTITNSTPVNDNNNHIPALPIPPGLYKCLLESCRNRKEIAVGLMFKHMERLHPHIYEKFQNQTATFKHKFENFCFMKGHRKYHRAFHVSNLGMFFLNLEVLQDMYLISWLSTPAPERRTNSLYYEIKFLKEGSTEQLLFARKVASNLHSKEWLGQRAQIMAIPPEEHNLSNDQFFSLDIKIVYKPPASTPGTEQSS